MDDAGQSREHQPHPDHQHAGQRLNSAQEQSLPIPTAIAPSPPPPPAPCYQYQLLYSKSRVTLHPTPYSRDNIPGYLALLRRHKLRRTDSTAASAGPSSQPLRRQFSTQDNSYDVMLSWLPEDLVKARSETAKFVDVELREAEGASQRGEKEEDFVVTHSDSGKVISMTEVVENESILVHPPPLASSSSAEPTSPASPAFSHPLGMLYSLQAIPPTISNWYGSLTISLVGGQTLAPLFFHDDESRTTILSMIRASKAPAYPPSAVIPSSSSAPAWGGDELMQQLKKYAFVHRSVHDHRIFLVNPDPEDLEVHSTPRFADDALDASPPGARRSRTARYPGGAHDAFVFPDDPFAPSYRSIGSGSGTSTPSRSDSNRESFTSWAKTTRMSLLSSFSQVTRSARSASHQILTSPSAAPYAAKLPTAVQSFAQAGPLGPFGANGDEVSKLSQKAGVMEYDSARVYLAKWARLVAEEGERNKLREEAKSGRSGAEEGVDVTAITEEGGLGGFEILQRQRGSSSSPLDVRRGYDPIQLVEFQSWFDPQDGRPQIAFDEFKSRAYARGLAASTRKLAWPFLLDVVQWNTSAAGRSACFAAKQERYRHLKRLWASLDDPSAQMLREREDVVDQQHRIRVDCLRTDRKHPMFAMGANTDGDGGDDGEKDGIAMEGTQGNVRPSEVPPLPEALSVGAGKSSRQAGQSESANVHIMTLGQVLLTYTLYDALGLSSGTGASMVGEADHAKLLEGIRINESEVGGYVQGMSDLCAPLYIVAEGDEAEAFWMLVGLMKRMRPNFLSSQAGMKTQLVQLQSLIRHADPPLYSHFEQTGSLNLFFCFRWLLVRFKREFRMEEVQRVWECCLALEPLSEPEHTSYWGQAPEKTATVEMEQEDQADSLSSISSPASAPKSPEPDPQAARTPHFHLFLCLSILLANRSPTIDYLDCFDEVLQFFQGLAGHMDIETVIAGAEKSWRGLRRRVEQDGLEAGVAPAPADGDGHGKSTEKIREGKQGGEERKGQELQEIRELVGLRPL